MFHNLDFSLAYSLIYSLIRIIYREHDLDEVVGDFENGPIVGLQYSAHSGTKLFYQTKVLEHPHQFPIPRDTPAGEEIFLGLSENEAFVFTRQSSHSWRI